MPIPKAFFAVSWILLLISCNSKHAASWTTGLKNIGTYSSARVADLNYDGVMDIILGAGTKEEVACDSAVLAFDGASGKLLWSLSGNNQYVGSAIFMDINDDQVPDIFIGGRWAQLSAINGANGKPIWNFYSQRKKVDGSDGGWYNFTTPQFIPDQDNDSLPDIIIANGGDARAAPFDTNRPAGRLLVISSKSGQILAQAVVPDNHETYMSVVCNKKENGEISVYFGTGGETLPGHLYRTTLSELMNGNISNAKILATSNTKGFVSSPVLVDINNDNTSDVIDNTVDGRMIAIDGATDSLIWEIIFPGTEAYTMPAIGLFNDDSIPDLFANFAIGTFPKLMYSVRFMVDGRTGKIEYQDTIPSFQYASAVAADLDGDGHDEVIVNESAMKRKQFENIFYSYLHVFNFSKKDFYAIGDSLPATNLASTPWVGDLDNDGKIDIIHTAVKYENAAFDLQQPVGLYIRRYSTDFPIKKEIKWGTFMGSNYNGVY